MLTLYRSMLTLRRTEPALRGAAFAWSDSRDDVLAFTRGDDLLCVVNLGEEPFELPEHTDVLLASGELDGTTLPTDTAAWLRIPAHL